MDARFCSSNSGHHFEQVIGEALVTGNSGPFYCLLPWDAAGRESHPRTLPDPLLPCRPTAGWPRPSPPESGVYTAVGGPCRAGLQVQGRGRPVSRCRRVTSRARPSARLNSRSHSTTGASRSRVGSPAPTRRVANPTTAVATNGFDTDARWNMVSGVTGSRVPTSLIPKPRDRATSPSPRRRPRVPRGRGNARGARRSARERPQRCAAVAAHPCPYPQATATGRANPSVGRLRPRAATCLVRAKIISVPTTVRRRPNGPTAHRSPPSTQPQACGNPLRQSGDPSRAGVSSRQRICVRCGPASGHLATSNAANVKRD